MKKNRVVILSGVSGSGKTFLAKEILAADYAEHKKFAESGDAVKGVALMLGYNSYTVSADNYFMVNGVHDYDKGKIEDAHSTCFRNFIGYLQPQARANLIVVDNTNLTNEEISPYILGANAFGFDAEIITLYMPIALAHARNVHNVSKEYVESQLNRLAARRLPPRWKNTDIAVPV